MMKRTDAPQKKIIMLMPYFGHWPEWFPFYLESCRWNPSIDWLFFTDCPEPENSPHNVRFVITSYPDYKKLISNALQIDFSAASPYKLCDIKPAYGFIHQEYLTGYDFFGFGDIDIIYGDIRAIYTDDLLSHNTISTISDRVSGHFFLMKNEEKWINAFRQVRTWKQEMSHPDHQSFDEYRLTKVLRGHRLLPSKIVDLMGILDPYKRNHLFKERYTTPLASCPWLDGTYNYPDKWYWRQGKLTTEFGGEFLYLHFMNWKSSKYLRKQYGKKAAWETLPRLVDPLLTDLSQGWCINSQGFTPLPTESEAMLQPLLKAAQYQ